MLDTSSVNAAADIGLDRPLARRRMLFFSLVAATTVALIWLAAIALSPGGVGAIDLLLLLLYAVTLPWLVIGLWNSVIGFCLMRFVRNPVAAIYPGAARVRGNEPVTARTAILVCIRNEAPHRVIRNLAPLMSGLVGAGVASRFDVFVLSDTSDKDLAAIEDTRFGALAAEWRNRIAVTYRRRAVNTGFKAGNIRDFCRRWGADYEFALTLDVDSFMTADAVLHLVRIMQADPKLGILQSLVVGMPSSSAFARLFQFGMRLGMRSYTVGAAWWQGDCGPYWGHNAVLRLAPFVAHCDLPDLPADSALGGPILSHDQIEAVLMRRGGWEVRVFPAEHDSWEENPATLIEFIRRDLRWCQGNMQYWHLLGLPGIKPISRYQLAFAILMFLGSPAWIGLLIVGTLAVAVSPGEVIRPGVGAVLLVATLLMWVSPKLATLIDVLWRPKERHAFGGALRVIASITAESVFSILLQPIMWFGHTMFLARLPFRRTVGWTAQVRDDHTVPLGLAWRALWPHTLLGVAVLGVLAIAHPGGIPYAVLLAGGLALSIPLAVITAWPSIGVAMARIGLARLPEETAVPLALQALALPVVELVRAPDGIFASTSESLRTVRGIVRSLSIYYARRGHGAAMDRLYARFVRPGDLVFDIGAHVGDRTAAFRRLGARVVAAEPQPALVRTLKLLYGRDKSVVIEPVALGRTDGAIELKINVDNPTVSTASDEFIAAAHGAPGWDGQAWTRRAEVPITTLDTLIARHGAPAFVKIDVEGFEAEVLAGLTHPLPVLSFEFTTIQRAVALAAIERCVALGLTRFDAALGETHTFVHDAWRSADEMRRWLAELPDTANSGDIYAVRP